MAAGFHAPILFDDDADIDAHQGADVGCALPIRADDLDGGPFCRQRGCDLLDAGILGAGIGVDFIQKPDLCIECQRFQRVYVGIQRHIRAGRGIGQDAAMATMHGLNRRGGAFDRRFA